MFGLKKKLKKLKKANELKSITACRSLYDIAFYLVAKKRLQSFHFVEIGVFKGDNVVGLMKHLQNYLEIDIKFTGFDLFDEIDYLKEHYPDDYNAYNQEEFPYWEFNSGGHTYANVNQKLLQSFKQSDFSLVKGDTTITFAKFVESSAPKVDLLYIDGCHDYVVVKADWTNGSRLFVTNPNLVVVFDDLNYPGVKAVYDEIEASRAYSIQPINENQFMVFLPQKII